MWRDSLRRAVEEPLVGVGILAAAALIAVGAPVDGRATAVESPKLVLERIEVRPPIASLRSAPACPATHTSRQDRLVELSAAGL